MHLGSTPRLIISCVLSLGLLSALGGSARAEFFNFSTTVTLTPTLPVGSTVGGTPISATDTTPTGTVLTFNGRASTPGPDHEDASGAGTDIVFGDISALVTAATLLETLNVSFVFHVSITDFSVPSGGVGSAPVVFDIAGQISGTTGAGKKVNLSTFSYSQPGVVHAVGSSIYTMSQFTYLGPGSSNSGAFGAHVVAAPNIPEPATSTLLALGALALSTHAYRTRRRKMRLSAG